MAEVHLLPSRFGHDGAERLVKTLEQVVMTNADLGPRWPQIQTLGQSLQQVGEELKREIDRMAFSSDKALEAKTLHNRLYQLAEGASRLGAIARSYPSRT